MPDRRLAQAGEFLFVLAEDVVEIGHEGKEEVQVVLTFLAG